MDEHVSEDIIVTIRQEAVLEIIKKFIDQNELLPEYVNSLFRLIHEKMTRQLLGQSKGPILTTFDPEYILYHEDDVNKTLASLKLDEFKKVK